MLPHNCLRSGKAFTLIELLVVIAIIAILAIVVVLTLNPAQLLAQSRDANRVSDMATLNSAIGLYQTDLGGAGSTGTSSIVYTSLSDTSSTCGNLNLPALPASSTYNCTVSTSTRNTNNSGWIPINFSNISAGSPLGNLPIDPVNSSSTGLFYTYNTLNNQFEVTALPESQKHKQGLGIKPMIPNYPDVIANGSSLTISPLFNASGLVGYWPMDEGSGSSTQDFSGDGNLGTWVGTTAGTNNTYYSAGKVGQYAGTFDGIGDIVGTGSNNFPIGSSPRSVFAWVNTPNPSSNYIAFSYGTYTGCQYSALWVYVNNSMFGSNACGLASGPSGIIANSWYFIGFTYNGGTAVTVYTNGVGWTTNLSTPLATVMPGSNPVAIGTGVGYGHIYQGLIDDVRIYNRALSAAEIQALYNAEK